MQGPSPGNLNLQQAQLNRVNARTPFGNIIHDVSPDGQASSQIRLTPQQTAIVSQAISNAAAPRETLSSEQVTNDLFGASMERLNPAIDQRRAALQERLTQSGVPSTGADIAPGAVSELDLLGRQENDLRLAALTQARQTGAQSRLADIQGTNLLASGLNNNAMQLAGGQLMGSALSPAPIDVLGGAQLGFNANMANAQMQQAHQGGKQNLFGQLGSAAMGAFF